MSENWRGKPKRACAALDHPGHGPREVTFTGRVLWSNRWVINPAADLT